MEFGPENSPVQEIANDLNVGALRAGTVSPMGPVVMDGGPGAHCNLKALHVYPNA